MRNRLVAYIFAIKNLFNMNTTQIVKNMEEKSVLVSRGFNAPLDLVWRAFTDCHILDQWWAPSPWRSETKYQDFKVGGYWLYAMVGPENQKHWGRMNYLDIMQHQQVDILDVFCDEQGDVNSDLPSSKGSMVFSTTNNRIMVEFKMLYSTVEQLQQIIEMGFEQGISMCLDQLDILISESKIA